MSRPPAAALPSHPLLLGRALFTVICLAAPPASAGDAAPAPAKGLDRPGVVYGEPRPHAAGVRAAPLRAGRWPLVLCSHGNGGSRHQNAFQTEHLASHGYVVTAPDHT